MPNLLRLLFFVSSVSATEFAGSWIRVSVSGPTCNVLNFGAVGDGRTDDTAAVTRAIAACTTATGGITLLPAGKIFLSSALKLSSKVAPAAFVVDGVLRFMNDTKTWPPAASHCLTFEGNAGIALAGVGTIDGQGAAWWPNPKAAVRPGLFYASNLPQLLIANLTFVDSPNHNLEVYVGNTEIVGVTVLAPPSTGVAIPSHNTDAIDLHGDYFYVHDSRLDVGDDNLAIHSSHVLAERISFGSGHGASIGSLGGAVALVNITVRDSTFDGTSTGVRVKVDSKGTTGYVKGVVYANLVMKNVSETVNVCYYYDVDGSCNYPGVASSSATSTMSLDILIVNVTSEDASAAGQLTCAASAGSCAGVTVQDVVHTGKAPKGWACQDAKATAAGTNAPALGAACLA
jgi:polygalacturonase